MLQPSIREMQLFPKMCLGTVCFEKMKMKQITLRICNSNVQQRYLSGELLYQKELNELSL